MSTQAIDGIYGADALDEGITSYRAISSAAVASLALGALSFLAFFSWAFGAVPILGLILAVLARRAIRARPDELTGGGMAVVGMLLSVVMLCGGWGWLGYSYATEVPPGCERISYAQLQPDPRVRGELVPQSALQLDGRKVFIKGFMYPGLRMHGIQEFVLCRDQGDCCFGGNPKLTDRIKVTLRDGKTVSLLTRQVSVAGTFRVDPSAGRDGLDGVYYSLEAFYFK